MVGTLRPGTLIGMEKHYAPFVKARQTQLAQWPAWPRGQTEEKRPAMPWEEKQQALKSSKAEAGDADNDNGILLETFYEQRKSGQPSWVPLW